MHQERCARKSAWDLAKKHLQSQVFGQRNVLDSWLMPAPTSKRSEERDIVVDPGASMHMTSKKELSSDEMGTAKRSRTPAVVLTANGEVRTYEEAQVFVHDLNHFVISWSCNYSKKRQLSHRQASFAKLQRPRIFL